ncbi:MAG: hypothetical protein EXS14_00400 [Planctomycetes bacterium]|nr:hypothetical protein [Planctomycetota bacterium]
MRSMYLTALIFACACVLSAQSPPAHPRLQFTAAELPALNAKVNASGTPAAAAYASCVTSAALQISGTLPSTSNQMAFVVMRSLRRLHEVSFRYALTGNATYGTNARNLLMQIVPLLTPTGASAYMMSSYPMVLAATYDTVYPLLTAAERAQVVAHLEAWIAAMKVGTNGVSSYSGYAAATDNHSFAWCAGIAFTGLAILGDSTLSTLSADITSNLAKINSGWRDAVSPDGSVDENTGYANYGVLYALHAARAAERCGYGNIVTGTNILRTPRWVAAALFGSDFYWVGDSSPTHKGTRMDPVLYDLVARTGDTEALWGLDRIFALNALGDTTPTQAFSPHVNKALCYPSGFVAQQPAVLSAFFRDNLNEGSPTASKTSNAFSVGDGGHALLHNSASSLQTQFGIMHMIRDEWMNHSHEDDGNLVVSSEGSHFFLDLGYASTSTYAGAQSSDHNIVLVQGVAGFGGDTNNYYNPPSPNARFLGKREAALVSAQVDYVRGNHANMWQMSRADRRVVLIKDASDPYMLLLDDVQKDTTVRTYEEIFHVPAVPVGAGTVASPLLCTSGVRTLRSVWMAPQEVNISAAAAVTSSGGITSSKVRVQASGASALYMSVHGRTAPSALLPLSAAQSGTVGGLMTRGTSSDKVLARAGSGSFGDAQTSGNGRMAWVRLGSSGIVPQWFAGECSLLQHEGQVLLLANRPVSVAARSGTLVINTDELAGPVLGAILRIGFNAASVVIDGDPVLFTQIGNRVVIGLAPTGAECIDDRGHSFEDGTLGDAVPFGALWIRNGRLTSSTGVAGVDLKAGGVVQAQPMSLGLTARFLPGAGANAAAWRLRTAGNEVLRLSFAPGASGSAILSAHAQGMTLGSVSVPPDLSGQAYRAVVRWNPASGTLSAFSCFGLSLGSLGTLTHGSPMQVGVESSAEAEVDDVTLFSSEEDGVTAQGVVLWGSSFGRCGIYLSHPALSFHTETSFRYGAQRLDPAVQAVWMQVCGMQESLFSSSVFPGSPAPTTLQEIGVQSIYPALNPLDPTQVGVTLSTASGSELLGRFQY